MKRIKSFSEFVNETFLEKPSDVDILDHNKKKMEKNEKKRIERELKER